MKLHLRMLGEKTLDIFGLVRRKIVENHVDFLGPFGAFHHRSER